MQNGPEVGFIIGLKFKSASELMLFYYGSSLRPGPNVVLDGMSITVICLIDDAV